MSHTFHKFYYHIVWGTKYREPIISSYFDRILKDYITKKICELGGLHLAFNTVNDHVHLLASVPPKISVSEFMHIVKGSSSHHINKTMGEKVFYWQTGFGALTLSEKGIPFVKKYIENQKERHQKNELIDLLEYIPDIQENKRGDDKSK